jgi:hypothetical protein
MAQANAYSSWSNFPQQNTFIPILLWLQNPGYSMGPGAPYSSEIAAMTALKINTILAIDYGSGASTPTGTCGTDPSGYNADYANAGIYVISGTNATNSTTDNGSVYCIQQIFSNLGKSKYLMGYNLGDEGPCESATMGATAITAQTYDTTRPFFCNMQAFLFSSGSDPSNVMKDYGIGSFDDYVQINGYAVSYGPILSPAPTRDILWEQGWQMYENVNTYGRGPTSQPQFLFVEGGNNALGASSQNGSTCTSGTPPLCSQGGTNHYFRTPAEMVNAEVWMGFINGALGLEWFADDSNSTAAGDPNNEVAYNFSLGSNASGNLTLATAAANNVLYIDTTLLNFAPEINSAIVDTCTMNTGASYSSYNTSCTGSHGVLTMSTGTSTVPGTAIVKNYNGTLYLFADTDRYGQANMTFTLSGYAGYKATVVYDSNAQYDPTNSSVGNTFTLNGTGQFSDTFGANSHNYQPKIYMISSGGPAAPTGLTAAVN